MPDVPTINTDMDSDLVNTDVLVSPFPSLVPQETPPSTTRMTRGMQDRLTSSTRERMTTTRDYSHRFHLDLMSWEEGNGSVLTTTDNHNTATTTRWTGRHLFRATTFSNTQDQPGGLPPVPEPLDTPDAVPLQMLQLGLPDAEPQQRDPPSWLPQPRQEDSFRPTGAEQVIAFWSVTGTTTTESIYVVPPSPLLKQNPKYMLLTWTSQRTLQLGGHLLSFDTHIAVGNLNSAIAIDMLSPLVIDLYTRIHR